MQKMLIWTTTMGVLMLLQTPLLNVLNVSKIEFLRGLIPENVLAQETPTPQPSVSPSPVPEVEETPAPNPPTPTPTPQPSPTGAPPTSTPNTMLLDQQGELQEGDKVLPSDKSLYDEYTFDGQQGQQITISLESSEFDTYLAVYTPDNQLLQEHDDINQNNSNSQITVTLPKTGTYRVIVNAYDSKGKGKYLLKVQ
ncbi:PPC domain-containing protein [Planktothrix sp. FACHB-1365]|nr:PPC domain-containing protein [Planktothrix sp. FACHB-1365]MBD2482130.1 PPC domain-containing protein [Planktothrix sp. FACHB-1365]